MSDIEALMVEERIRALIVEAIGSAFETLEKRLGERLDELAIDIEAVNQRLDYFSVELRTDMKEVKHHLAKLSREDIRDRRRIQTQSDRLDALEKRMRALEGRKET